MNKAILAVLITMVFGFGLTAFAQTPSPTASPTASSSPTASPTASPTVSPLPPGLPFITRAQPWPNRNTHDLMDVADGTNLMFAEYVGTSPPTVTRITSVLPWLYSRPPLAVNQIIGDPAGDGVMVWGAPGAFGIPTLGGWTPNRLFVSDPTGTMITATDGFYLDSADRMTIGTLGSGHILVPGSGLGSEQFGSAATASGDFSLAIGFDALASGQNSMALGNEAEATNAGSIAIGRSSLSTFTRSIAIGPFNASTTALSQFVIGNQSAAGFMLNMFAGAGVQSAVPRDFTINATGGVGTDIVGSEMRIAGGMSTGSAAGGDAVLAVSLPGVSGAVQNPLTDILTVSGLDGSVTGAAVDLYWDGNLVYDSTIPAWGFQDYILSGSAPVAGLGAGDIGGVGPTNNLQWDESLATLFIRKNAGGDISTLSGVAGTPSVINKQELDSDTEIYADAGMALSVDAGERRITINGLPALTLENVEISADTAAISKGFVELETDILAITNATNATPIVITTSVPHGQITGNAVTISGVLGNTAANGGWTITFITATTFSLNGSVGNGSYLGGGTVTTITDDVSFITKATGTFLEGEIVVLMSAANSDTITVKHNAAGADNIFLDGATDKILDTSRDKLGLIRRGSEWHQRFFSNNSFLPEMANQILNFIGEGAGGAATTPYLIGASKGEEFTSLGDENYLNWVWPPDLLKTFDVTLNIVVLMNAAGAVGDLISFDVDIDVVESGASAAVVTGTVAIVDAPINLTANTRFLITANVSSGTFLTAAGIGWDLRIERVASSNEPAAGDDPVITEVYVEYSVKSGIGD
jgi:hypothetical protein